MPPRRLATIALLVLLALLGLWWASGVGTEPPNANGPAASAEESLAAAARDAGTEDPDGLRVAARSDPAPLPAQPTAAAAAPTAGLRVFVRDETGRAVPGCKVSAAEASAITDARGGAEFTLDEGRTFVAVDPPADRRLRLRTGWQTLRARAVVEVVLTLVPRQDTLQWCRLVADEDGRPLAGIPVQVQPAGTLQHSGADGLVQLAFGPDDTHADAKGPGRSVRRIVAEPGHDAEATAMRVPLAPGASLRVVFVDPANAPVAPASVTLTANPWNVQWPLLARARGPELVWSGSADTQGVVELADLPVGVGLRATFAGPTTHAAPDPAIWVLAGAREERRVAWAATGEVRGVVRDEGGAPVPNVGVRAVRTQAAVAPRGLGFTKDHLGAATDAEGRFRISGLGPGAWLVGLVAEAPFAPACVRTELAAGGSTDVELRVARGLEITGRALAPDGRPAPGVTVNVLADDEFLRAATTDRDGRFRLRSLPSGPCELLTDPFEGDLGLDEPVQVQAGAEDVELRLAAVSGSISGRSSGGDDVWIMAWRRGSSDAMGRGAELDGSFCYLGMRVGTWDIGAQDRRGQAAVALGVQVLPGRETTVQLDLAPGATLQPLHGTADEFVVQRLDQVAARDNLQPGIRGEAVVPAGTWTVVFLTAGREVTRREITVAAGATVVVDGTR